MKPAIPIIPEASRVSRYRRRLAAEGIKRVEVTVPSGDAPLVRAIAGVLRSEGEEAEIIRRSLQPTLIAPTARAGSELVAFFRASPLAEAELESKRDRSIGRSADLGCTLTNPRHLQTSR